MQKALVLALFILLRSFQPEAVAQNLPGPGNALVFDGIDDYINCGTNDRGVSRQVTTEAWIRTQSNRYQWVAGKYKDESGTERGYHLITIDGKASINGRVGAGYYVSSGPSTTKVNDGKWHHLAGVCDNNRWLIYVDGVLESSNLFPYNTANLKNSLPLVIGFYYDQTSRYFDGEIDEVRVWNTARTALQIREAMCHKFAVAPPDLVAYYRFDQATGSNLVDAGSQPSTGVLQNFSMPVWRRSGAALGDRSTFTYTPATTPSVTLPAGAGAQVKASAFTSAVRGVQLYVVDSPPSTPSPGGSNQYFGVFSIGQAARYQAAYLPANTQNCDVLYSRLHNASLTWARTTGPTTLIADDTYRGEYSWSTGATAPRPSITGDTMICAGGAPVVLTAAAAAGATFRWNTGATTAAISVSQPGTYTVLATSGRSCVGLDSIHVRSLPDSLTVPNIITPDQDGFNDAFVVSNTCGQGPWECAIYSRWGRRVFNSAAYRNDWTAADLPAGTYYYWLRQPATAQVYKGWVEVVR